MHQQGTARSVKPGELVRFKVDGPVWIRGEYCRASRRYEFQAWTDANRFTLRKADAIVYHGFTF